MSEYNFGETVREIRKLTGLRQVSLAGFLGISQKDLDLREQNVLPFTLWEYERIASLCQITLAELMESDYTHLIPFDLSKVYIADLEMFAAIGKICVNLRTMQQLSK